eukprot:TRINITY_DN8877_c0_g1_i3.p1 TRINITY_DN8877_c0_g1~~TRINITY_DN8877_c0_g1_i3.p1  ORF type:complete len:203 (-),score=79.67 TRINITY_DN8877_c0_g1_i3:218-796(-)
MGGEVMPEEKEEKKQPGVVAFDGKLKVLLQELQDMRERDPSAKALVFTQFNDSLEWLKRELTRARVVFRTITGSMSANQRQRQLEGFQKDPGGSVFLLSVRTGAVGLTLTAANYVFMLEPCLNPALELQARNRVYRMGQTKPVFIKKLIMQDTLEEKILDITKNKQTASFAGNLASDKETLRMNELMILFSR